MQARDIEVVGLEGREGEGSQAAGTSQLGEFGEVLQTLISTKGSCSRSAAARKSAAWWPVASAQ